jgi:hypothetical protein
MPLLPLLFGFILGLPDKRRLRFFMKRHAEVLVVFYDFHFLPVTDQRYKQIFK